MSLEIENLTVQYKTELFPILKKLNFQAHSGNLYVIIGNNASGKSTLLRAIVKQFFPGTLDSVSGKVICDSEINRVLQRVKSQILTFSVKEELGLKLAFKEIGREDRHKLISDISNKFNIMNLLEKDPHQLSSGQLQLIIILSSIIDTPGNSVIIMDEPLSLLDFTNTKILDQLLIELKQQGHTIIITTPVPISLDSINHNLRLNNGQLISESDLNPGLVFNIPDKDKSLNFFISGKIGYKTPILLIDVKIPSDGILLVTGPNGSGKTTFLKTISGIIPMISGKMKIQNMFFLPQDPINLFWRKSLEDEIEDIPDWMENLKQKSPFTISEGERKKVALYLAFQSGQNIALDEPTQSLDPLAIQWFLNMLMEEAMQKLIVIATNDLVLINLIKAYSNHIELSGDAP